MSKVQPCPCGSGEGYPVCCGHYIEAGALASCAEALMRSRYVAYSQNNEEYLLKTWHASTRPEKLALAPSSVPKWISLSVIKTKNGGVNDSSGTVEFIARYEENGQPGQLHEVSRFVKEGGQWFYVGGDIKAADVKLPKVSRNAPCPCGSGKKYKRCCGA